MPNVPAPTLRRSVRARIGLAFSALALLLFGITGLLSSDVARRQVEADAQAALQALAERLALQLDADMAARLQQVEQLAAMPSWAEAPLGPEAWRDRFERLQRRSPYSWIGLASPQGDVVAASGGLLQGRSVAQRPWFVQGLRGPMVGDVHDAVLLAALLPPMDNGEPQRFVDVAAPLRTRDGALLGVIGAHLSWQWAEDRRREALALVQARPETEIVLVDRAGATVLGPTEPSAAGLAQAGARVLRWSDGRDYLTAASASRARGSYPGMGWTVVVRQPLSTARAAANAVQQRVWLLGLLGALVFGLVGWWLAGRLTAPLRALAQQARAGGAPDAAGDEVGQLAASLGRLLENLRAANETLETRVAERTASLQRANEDLREFTRSVSHDLRGPLGAMAMVLRQRLDEEAPGPARERLAIVANEADRLRLLTEELLTLAMVEQRELRSAPVDHAALVQAVRENLPGAETAQWEVAPLPTLPGDALMLRQVWTNLLSNALKFSSRTAAPRIEVRVQPGTDECIFEVADNGAGFDPAQAARLFGVFQRLHAASQFPGTGVGLSIVRRVVHRHGGRVWAESQPEQGARFFFALPRRAPADTEAGTPATSAPGEGSTAQPGPPPAA